jgi:hypothetical protein
MKQDFSLRGARRFGFEKVYCYSEFLKKKGKEIAGMIARGYTSQQTNPFSCSI